jgi:UDP-glucose 4-epimerase
VSLEGRRVAVTGGAGMIGAALVQRLLRERVQAVTVIDSAPPERRWRLAKLEGAPRLTIAAHNVRDADSLATTLGRHDVVYHLAAATDMRRGADDPAPDIDDGVLATHGLLEAMRRSGVRELIFSSSSAVYGNLCSRKPAGEDDGPLLPISTYGAGKLAAEGLVSAFVSLFGLRARIVRLGTVVGPTMDHGVVISFLRQLLARPGALRVLGDGHQRRSFIALADVVDGLVHVFGREPEGCCVLNLSAPGTTSVREVADIVRSRMGAEELPVRYEETAQGWRGDVPIVHMDLARLHAGGWRASRTSSEAVAGCVDALLQAAPDTVAPELRSLLAAWRS